MSTISGSYLNSYIDYEHSIITCFLVFNDSITNTNPFQWGGASYLGNPDNTFSFNALPSLFGSQQIVQLYLKSNNAQFKVYKEYQQQIQFNDTPRFLAISSPSNNQTNVGNTPLLVWQNSFQLTQLELFGYHSGNQETVYWTIETPDTQFQIPEFSFFHLTDYEEVNLEMNTRSYWDDGFAKIDLMQTLPSDYTELTASIQFYPG